MRTPMTYSALFALIASVIALVTSGCATTQWNPNATPGVIQSVGMWTSSPKPTTQIIAPNAAPVQRCSTRTIVNTFGAYQDVQVCQ